MGDSIMTDLPQGFTLDAPSQGLPQGFTLDEQDSTLGEGLLGGAEVAGTVLSSAISEPIAGLAGIVSSLIGDPSDGASTVNLVRDALTFEPKSKEGKAKLKSLGEFVQPLGEAVSGVESFLGKSVLDATGWPELAAVAHSLPTAALELLGVKGLRSAKSPLKGERLSRNIGKAIKQSAPDIQTINSAKTAAYKQLDNFGVKIQPKTYDTFTDGLSKKLNAEGLDPVLTPKANAAIKRMLDEKGAPKSLQDMDTIRKRARAAALDPDKTESKLGSMIINDLDRGMEKLSSDIGGKFKEARGLAQRAFKSQDISDMIDMSSLTASGMENGLRIEARKMLKQIVKKQRKGFSPDEVNALRDVVEGTTAANAAKFLGKFGISEGQATSMLGFSVGAGGGGALGSVFGPVGAAVGAVTVPAIGQIAKNTAQRLTLNNVKFADDLVRSGKNAKAVVRTYLKHTPIKNRSVSDLTDLLLDQNLNISDIKSLPKSSTEVGKLVADAKFFAEEIKRRAQQAASVTAITTPQVQEQN